MFRKLAEREQNRIPEGPLMADHVHMLISISPKYLVPQVIGFSNGKSAILLTWVYGEWKHNFADRHFWMRGF